jgi:hypothetical protein
MSHMVTKFSDVQQVIDTHSLQIKSIALASGLSERTLHNALKGHYPPRETTQRLIVQGTNAILLARFPHDPTPSSPPLVAAAPLLC